MFASTDRAEDLPRPSSRFARCCGHAIGCSGAERRFHGQDAGRYRESAGRHQPDADDDALFHRVRLPTGRRDRHHEYPARVRDGTDERDRRPHGGRRQARSYRDAVPHRGHDVEPGGRSVGDRAGRDWGEVDDGDGRLADRSSPSTSLWSRSSFRSRSDSSSACIPPTKPRGSIPSKRCGTSDCGRSTVGLRRLRKGRRHEEDFDAWVFPVDVLVQVRFDNAVVVQSETFAERILRDLEPAIHITS